MSTLFVNLMPRSRMTKHYQPGNPVRLVDDVAWLPYLTERQKKELRVDFIMLLDDMMNGRPHKSTGNRSFKLYMMVKKNLLSK